MKISKEQIINDCGITEERLDKMLKRKDCPKKLVDEHGQFDSVVLDGFLERIKKANEAAKRSQQKSKEAVKAVKRPRKQRAAETAETFDEFTLRFWSENTRWVEYLTVGEVNEVWARYFIQAALEFGYNESHKEK